MVAGSSPARLTTSANQRKIIVNTPFLRVGFSLPYHDLEATTSQIFHVENAAKKILSGESVAGYTMANVADIVAERITTDMLQKIYVSVDPALQPLFEFQQLIGECAQLVAFEALGLSSNPFIDYPHLVAWHEENNAHKGDENE